MNIDQLVQKIGFANMPDFHVFFDELKPSVTIYLLIHKSECVYIGASRGENIFSRLHTHVMQGKKKFDSVKLLHVRNRWKGFKVESLLIRQFKPKYNDRNVDSAKYSDVEFCNKLKTLLTL